METTGIMTPNYLIKLASQTGKRSFYFLRICEQLLYLFRVQIRTITFKWSFNQYFGLTICAESIVYIGRADSILKVYLKKMIHKKICHHDVCQEGM